MSLVVLDPGLYSLVVDAGRPHSRSLGVPAGGAADRGAFHLGNALLGNDANAPALELSLRGPTLRAEHAIACVVFGAPFAISVNQRPKEAGTTFTLEAGDVLRIGGTPTGARGYLCVAGGFESPVVLGSHSALEPLKTGDGLKCRESRIGGRSLPFVAMPGLEDVEPLSPKRQRGPFALAGVSGSRSQGDSVPGPQLLRVLDGPQRDWFLDDAFWKSTYEVSPASNRMGLRLQGAKLSRRPGEMISEAVAPGAVQVANDGLPIVLGADGQTIGGYPKIAHVIRADLDRVAQLRPGDRVRFERVEAQEAEAAAKTMRDELRDWQRRLALGEGTARFDGKPSH